MEVSSGLRVILWKLSALLMKRQLENMLKNRLVELDSKEKNAKPLGLF